MELGSSLGWIIGNATNAAFAAADARRANNAIEQANDFAGASHIYAASARQHAEAAAEAEVHLIGALAEIQRLRELVDELSAERNNLLAEAADLLDENERLLARQ